MPRHYWQGSRLPRSEPPRWPAGRPPKRVIGRGNLLFSLVLADLPNFPTCFAKIATLARVYMFVRRERYIFGSQLINIDFRLVRLDRLTRTNKINGFSLPNLADEVGQG